MTQPDLVFELGSEESSAVLVEELQKCFPGRTGESRTERRTYYDTFDWRLHRAQGCLALDRTGAGSLLIWLPNHGARPVRSAIKKSPEFAGDLPAGELRSSVERIVTVRRFLPLVEVESAKRCHDILDKEEKTLVRAEVCERRARSPKGEWASLSTTVTVRGLLGYDAEREALVRFLKYRASLPVSERGEFESALGAIGKVPGANPSALDLELPSGATAGEAVRLLLRGLLDNMRCNEDGVLRRRDTEHLHDFRIAVRRTRAVLTQLGSVFPPAVHEHYRDEFHWLDSETGLLRDLHVLAIQLPGYESELPTQAQEALQPLHAQLGLLQDHEQSRVAATLRGKRYKQLVSTWPQYLDQTDVSSLLDARKPGREFVGRAIWKCFRRIRRDGRDAVSAGPGASLHALDIECKKLRSLLELLGGLYDASEVKRAVKPLKRLQKVMGKINDLEVHSVLLGRLLEGKGASGLAPVSAARSVGRLEEVLARRAVRECARLEKRFERFASEKTRARFSKLFKYP